MSIDKSWTTWISSDQHYNHDAVIGFCDRPFSSVEEMNEAMIFNWNKVVKSEDLCIFVGDVFMHSKPHQIKEILSRLNGDRKVLIFGNHDRERRQMMNLGFTLVVDEMIMTIANEKVHFSHYPFRMNEWLHKWVKLKAFFYKILIICGIPVKPIYFDKYHERRPIDRGQFLIHGHTHSKHKINGRAIHVGVDARKYNPVNIQQISNEINEIKRNGIKYIKYQNSNED